MRLRLLPVAGLVLASILACSTPAPTSTEKDVVTPPAPTPPAEPTQPMTVPPAPTPPPTPTATSDVAVGVIECDEYIIKMTECLGKMDGSAKDTLTASFTQTREAWKAAAATPQGKAGLSATCKTALDSLTKMTCAPTAVEEEKKAEAKDDKDDKDDRNDNRRRGSGAVRPPPGQGQGRNR